MSYGDQVPKKEKIIFFSDQARGKMYFSAEVLGSPTWSYLHGNFFPESTCHYQDLCKTMGHKYGCRHSDSMARRAQIRPSNLSLVASLNSFLFHTLMLCITDKDIHPEPMNSGKRWWLGAHVEDRSVGIWTRFGIQNVPPCINLTHSLSSHNEENACIRHLSIRSWKITKC